MSYKDTGITFKTSAGKKSLSLKKAIDSILTEVADETQNALTEAMDETGLWTTQELRAVSMSHGWKHYAKGWTYSREGKKGNTVKVYNATHYQLTHLLEKGHRIVTTEGKDTGKRAKSIPHIYDVNELVPDKIDELFEKRLKEAGFT